MKLTVSIQIHIILLFTATITMTSWFFFKLVLTKNYSKKILCGLAYLILKKLLGGIYKFYPILQMRTCNREIKKFF